MKRCKSYLLHTLWLLCCFFVFEKSHAANDSLAVKKIIEQADEAGYENPAASHRLFDEAKKLSDNEELRLYYAQALFLESFVFFREAKYREVIDHCTIAADIFTSFNRMISVAKCYNQIGLSWQYLNDYAQALHFLFRGLKIAESEKDLKLTGRFYTNIGLAYETLEDWENTLAYAQKSLEIKKQFKDTSGLAKVYNNIANAYYYQKKDSPAAVFFRLSRANYIFLQDSMGMAITAHDLGTLLTEQKQYDSALHYLQLSLVYLEQHKESSFVVHCLTLYALSYTHLQKGNIKEAKRFMNECSACETEIEDLALKKNLYATKYAYYKKIGNIPAAFKNLELMQSAGDSLFQQSKNFENQRIGIRYEFDQKAMQDSLNYQLRLAEQQKTTAEYRGRMYLLAVGALLVAGVAGFFYTRSNINRKRQLIAQQQTQLAEGKALRAQMNPHFIFNCLNTIDSFVLQDKQQDASRLIQRFSKLSRRILEHTSENYVTVQQELETLNIYLQIEQVRKNQQFSFTIDADPDTLKYLIPPMLLQPFVENAVLHGMKGMPEGKGFIGVKVAKDRKYAFFEIEDNGIGRRKAMELKRAQPETHKSLSMEITLQRLETLHGHKRQEEYIRFTDFEPPQQGTRVEIVIPLKTDNDDESNHTG